MKPSYILIAILIILLLASLLFFKHDSFNSFSEPITTESHIQPEQPITLLFVGDIMLDRAIARTSDAVGYEEIFNGFEDVYKGVDLVVANLEGSVTSQPSVSKWDYKQMRFTFDPKVAEVLHKFNIRAVSLANNHALDFGNEGYIETTQHLSSSSLSYFGSPLNRSNLSKKISIKGKDICFVGYHDLFTFDETSVISEIQKIRSNCWKVFVLPHWGDEYEDLPNARQEELGKKFIDAGADGVIGAHPHVVQPFEIYKEKPIFYSLGNHIFDQKLSFETEHGISIRTTLTSTSTSFEFIPSEMKNFQIQHPNREDSKKTIERLLNGNFTDDATKEKVKQTNFLKIDTKI